LIGEAIKKSRAYVDLREFDNAKSVAAILQKSRNKVFLDSSVLGLNVAQRDREEKK
jgi:prohibitin 2